MDAEQKFYFDIQCEERGVLQRQCDTVASDEMHDTTFTMKKPIFRNQVQFGRKITSHFLDKSKFMVMAIAPTQSGKTGSMISTAMFMCKHDEIRLPKENVFVLTGLSSKDWVEQTKDRFPDEISDNVFHRNTLDNFVQKMEHKTNVLIMVDECQYACLPGQALHKAFMKAGLMNLDNILSRNIKILMVSATPDGVVYDINAWKQGSVVEYMHVPDSYVSIHDLFENNQVRQYKDLCGYDKVSETIDESVMDNISALLEFIDINDPKVHLIRTHNSKLHNITMNNFKKCFKEFDFTYLSETSVKMFKIMKEKPEKHTFIFIKEKLRCAHTIDKTYLGILYERHTKTVNDSAMIQGLAGRMTGYHKNTTSIVFTNMNSIHKYKELLNCKFQPDALSYSHQHSTPTRVRGEEDNVEAAEQARENMAKVLQQMMAWNSNSTKKSQPYTKGTFLCAEESHVYKKKVSVSDVTFES